jgi:hypothetical protein
MPIPRLLLADRYKGRVDPNIGEAMGLVPFPSCTAFLAPTDCGRRTACLRRWITRSL